MWVTVYNQLQHGGRRKDLSRMAISKHGCAFGDRKRGVGPSAREEVGRGRGGGGGGGGHRETD